jgi:hypothetical protein
MGSSYHKNLSGPDLHAPSRYGVINDTASTIPALLCVKFSGIGTNGQPSIVPCNPSDIVDGITEISMLTGVADYVTSNGLLFNVNTAAWTVGTKLYCGAGGILTDIPTAYSPVANVLRSDAVTGTLFIYLSGGSGGTDPDYTTTFVIGDWEKNFAEAVVAAAAEAAAAAAVVAAAAGAVVVVAAVVVVIAAVGEILTCCPTRPAIVVTGVSRVATTMSA